MHRKEGSKESYQEKGVLCEACFISEDGGSIYYFLSLTNRNDALDIVKERIALLDPEQAHKLEHTNGQTQLECLFGFHNPQQSRLDSQSKPQVRLAYMNFKQPNGREIWIEWSKELTRREEEVQETLRNEGVLCEACFQSTDQKGVFYFMQLEDYEKAKQAVEKSDFKIDREHGEKRRLATERGGEVECLFHFV